MCIIGILFMIFSLTIAVCGHQSVTAQSPVPRELPPSISVETVQQLVLRQTLDEEHMLYYDPQLHPSGETALYMVMDTTDYMPVITVFDTFTGDQLLAITTEDLSESWDDRYVTSVDYSPDGISILIGVARTGSDPGELIIVDAASGKELDRVSVEHFSHGGAAYALNGKVIVAARYDFEPGAASLLILDTATGDQLGSLPLDAPANRLATSGNTIAYSTYEGDTVIAFELSETGVSFSDPIYSSELPRFGYYVFSPDGSLFTTYVSGQHAVRLYSTIDGSLQTTIQVPGEPDSNLFDAYTDGELVVVAEDDQVLILDMAGTLLTKHERLTTVGRCRMDAQRITLVCTSESDVSIWGIEPVD